MKTTRKCRSTFRGSSTYLTGIELGNHRSPEEILSQSVITDGTRGHKVYRMQSKVENAKTRTIQFHRIASYEFLRSSSHILDHTYTKSLFNDYVNNYRQNMFNILLYDRD